MEKCILHLSLINVLFRLCNKPLIVFFFFFINNVAHYGQILSDCFVQKPEAVMYIIDHSGSNQSPIVILKIGSCLIIKKIIIICLSGFRFCNQAVYQAATKCSLRVKMFGQGN